MAPADFGVRRAVAACAAWLLMLLCFGCATSTEYLFNPTLFPRPPVDAERQVPGRVAVWMAPGVPRMAEVSPMYETMRVPVGSMVESATQAAASDAFRGGAVVLAAAPSPSSEFDAVLLIEAVRLSVEVKIEIPPDAILPIPGRVDYGHLTFDVSLLDSQGRKRWTRNYDAGRERWYPNAWGLDASAALATSPTTYNVMRRSHQAAWRLAQQVAKDVSDWLSAERTKPRAQ